MANGDGGNGTGLLQTETEAQLRARRTAETDPGKNVVAMSALATHITHSYEEARLHRETLGITDRLLRCRRLRRGRYDEKQLQQITKTGGSRLYYNIVGPKCLQFIAWVEDVFSPQTDTPWDILPTPIPSLMDEEANAILDEVGQAAQDNPEITADQVKELAVEMWEERLKAKREEAKAKAENMKKLMEDQMAEGGFVEALGSFMDDLSIYPTAIMKGPIFKRSSRLEWVNGEMKKVERIIPTWKTVDPFMFFPGVNVTDVNNGYVCERFVMTKASLWSMVNVTGWSEKSITAVLADGGRKTTTQNMNYGDVEHGYLEDRDPIKTEGISVDSVEGVEFSGSVRGDMLLEWGMSAKAVPDKDAFYEINAMLIGNHVVKAVINPDPLNRRSYYVASFQKNRNSVWGLNAIPEQLEGLQQGVNGSQRSLMNNLSLSSGPQVVVDLDALHPGQLPTVNKLHPWKVWTVNGNKVGNRTRSPITFFQPQSNAAELVNVTQYYEDKADDRTLIPKFVTGDTNIGGAGRTASGLSMLMSAASRGIKRVIRTVDKDVMRPLLERMYSHNMLDPTQSDQVKGDAQIVPKGALAALIREQTQLRRQEFLQSTANELDFQILGIKGRAALLRETAKSLDMDVDKIIPTDEEIDAQIEGARQEAQGSEEEIAAAEAQAAAEAAQQPAPAE